jgi:serine O-acetyltransferase
MNTFLSDIFAQKLDKINAFTIIKALLFNQAVQMLLLYRVARKTMVLPIIGPTISMLLSYVSKVLTSCHVSTGAIILPGTYFPHATGIVIGEGVVIEGGATIYQNVTIGRKDSNTSSYPIIRELSIIYAGAVVIGGVKIGSHSVVAENSFVFSNVIEGVVGGVPAKVLSISESVN